MKTIHTTLAALTMAGAALLTGCATNGPAQLADSYPQQAQAPESASSGVIDSIQVVQASAGSSGAGAVAGGLVGGLLGNQIGSGGGRSVATIAGAVGGALMGNEVEKNRGQGHATYQISVRLNNGDYRTVNQDSVQDLRVGTRVRLVDNHVYRY